MLEILRCFDSHPPRQSNTCYRNQKLYRITNIIEIVDLVLYSTINVENILPNLKYFALLFALHSMSWVWVSFIRTFLILNQNCKVLATDVFWGIWKKRACEMRTLSFSHFKYLCTSNTHVFCWTSPSNWFPFHPWGCYCYFYALSIILFTSVRFETIRFMFFICTFNIGDMIWKVTCFYRLKVHMYLQNININDKIYIIHMPTLHNRDNDDDWVEPIQLRRNILLSSTSLRIKLTSQKFRWFIAVVTIITR